MKAHVSITLAFVPASLVLAACGDAPLCPSGATWVAAERRCVCDEDLARDPETQRCVDPESLDGGAVSQGDGSLDDGSVARDGATIVDGALGDGSTGALDGARSCDECPAPPAHGIATCEDGVCGIACEDGLELVEIDTGARREPRCSAFGGAYVRRTDGTCIDANPLTGECGCGAFNALEIDWRIDTGNPRAVGKLGICEIASAEPTSSYGGAYVVEEEPRTTCLSAHAVTGRCECPAGYETTRGWVGRNDIDRLTRIVVCLSSTPEPGAPVAAAFTELRCPTEGGGTDVSCASGDRCVCPVGTTALPIASGVARGPSGECEGVSVICATR